MHIAECSKDTMLTLPLKERLYNQALSKTQGCEGVIQHGLSCIDTGPDSMQS